MNVSAFVIESIGHNLDIFLRWKIACHPVFDIQDYLCIAPFMIQSLQSNFTGNYVSKIDLYCRNLI